MEKVIHVLDNNSAEGTLRELFKTKGISDETVCFHHSLCYGIIPTRTTYEACVDEYFRYATPSERKRRKEYLARFYAIDFSEYDKIVVWHSNDTNSQCFLYLMASIMSDRHEKDIMFEADISKALSHNELSRRSNPIDHTLQTGCCTVNDYLAAMNHVSKIDGEKFEKLMSRWQDLLNKSRLSPFRFVKDDDIIVLNEDWMDKAILEQLSLNPSKHNLYRDTSAIFYKIDHVVGYDPIFARIKQKADEWGYHITYNRYIEKRVQ